MKVTFHLNGGGTVVLDLVTIKEATMAEHQNGWLWDKHGAGVQLSAVVGITPGETASGDPIYPDVITDGGGDIWERVSAHGTYRLAVLADQAVSNGRVLSFSDIKEAYGIREEG